MDTAESILYIGVVLCYKYDQQTLERERERERERVLDDISF